MSNHHNYLPTRLTDTHPSYQSEYGYLFGFIPIHVNSSLFDLYDYFEYPKWYKDYLKLNELRQKYPEFVTAIQNDTDYSKPDLSPVCYGPHLKEPLDPEHGIRRGFEMYQQDIDFQRNELQMYNKVLTRQTISRPTRLCNGILTKPPREQRYDIHGNIIYDNEHQHIDIDNNNDDNLDEEEVGMITIKDGSTTDGLITTPSHTGSQSTPLHPITNDHHHQHHNHQHQHQHQPIHTSTNIPNIIKTVNKPTRTQSVSAPSTPPISHTLPNPLQFHQTLDEIDETEFENHLQHQQHQQHQQHEQEQFHVEPPQIINLDKRPTLIPVQIKPYATTPSNSSDPSTEHYQHISHLQHHTQSQTSLSSINDIQQLHQPIHHQHALTHHSNHSQNNLFIPLTNNTLSINHNLGHISNSIHSNDNNNNIINSIPIIPNNNINNTNYNMQQHEYDFLLSSTTLNRTASNPHDEQHNPNILHQRNQSFQHPTALTNNQQPHHHHHHHHHRHHRRGNSIGLFNDQHDDDYTSLSTSSYKDDSEQLLERVHITQPVDQFTFEPTTVKPPYIQHLFYETVSPLLPRMLIEFLVPFSMVVNAHLSWISWTGPWSAIVSTLLIYSALHVSTSHVNTGITCILTGMIGWVSEWKWYILCHALGQLAALIVSYAVLPSYIDNPNNVLYVPANTGPPEIISAGAMHYHPLLCLFAEGSVLAVIAINFTGKFWMQDAMVSGEYFWCTGAWSAIINYLFRPYFYIAFDGWFGIWNSIYTYWKNKTDLSTLLMQIFVYSVGPWVGGFIGGSLCRLSLHLEQQRWEKYGFYTIWNYLATMTPKIRSLWYTRLQSKTYTKLRGELDYKLLTKHAKDLNRLRTSSITQHHNNSHNNHNNNNSSTNNPNETRPLLKPHNNNISRPPSPSRQQPQPTLTPQKKNNNNTLSKIKHNRTPSGSIIPSTTTPIVRSPSIIERSHSVHIVPVSFQPSPMQHQIELQQFSYNQPSTNSGQSFQQSSSNEHELNKTSLSDQHHQQQQSQQHQQQQLHQNQQVQTIQSHDEQQQSTQQQQSPLQSSQQQEQQNQPQQQLSSSSDLSKPLATIHTVDDNDKESNPLYNSSTITTSTPSSPTSAINTETGPLVQLSPLQLQATSSSHFDHPSELQ